MVTIWKSPWNVLNKLCHVWTMNKLCVSLKRTAVLHNNFQCNQMHVQTMLTCFKICWLKAQCLFVFIILLCNMKLCYNNTPLLENSVKWIDMIWIDFELIDSLLRIGSIIRRLLLYAKLWWIKNECLGFPIWHYTNICHLYCQSDTLTILKERKHVQKKCGGYSNKRIMRWIMHNLCRKLN